MICTLPFIPLDNLRDTPLGMYTWTFGVTMPMGSFVPYRTGLSIYSWLHTRVLTSDTTAVVVCVVSPAVEFEQAIRRIEKNNASHRISKTTHVPSSKEGQTRLAGYR